VSARSQIIASAIFWLCDGQGGVRVWVNVRWEHDLAHRKSDGLDLSIPFLSNRKHLSIFKFYKKRVVYNMPTTRFAFFYFFKAIVITY